MLRGARGHVGATTCREAAGLRRPPVIAQPASAVQRVEACQREVRAVADIVQPGGVLDWSSPFGLHKTRDAIDLRRDCSRVVKPPFQSVKKANGKPSGRRLFGLLIPSSPIGRGNQYLARGCHLDADRSSVT